MICSFAINSEILILNNLIIPEKTRYLQINNNLESAFLFLQGNGISNLTINIFYPW